jgi:hypothetical protein
VSRRHNLCGRTDGRLRAVCCAGHKLGDSVPLSRERGIIAEVHKRDHLHEAPEVSLRLAQGLDGSPS